jgi:hypothetical protein
MCRELFPACTVEFSERTKKYSFYVVVDTYILIMGSSKRLPCCKLSKKIRDGNSRLYSLF